MRYFIGFVLLLFIFTACGPDQQVVMLSVLNHDTDRGIDSAVVALEAKSAGGSRHTISTFATNDEGKLRFVYSLEEGTTYWVSAQRIFFEPLVNEKGDAYLHEAQLGYGDSSIITLELGQIEAPDPAILTKIREDIPLAEALASLRANGWKYALLPQLTWQDVPALLDAAGDTTLVSNYPTHPTSTYKPKQARVGLVALWMIEAIRKMEMKGTDEAQHIVPPSRAPILGTKEGNPTGHNTADQILRAQQAYRAWYEAVQAAAPSRRMNEMRNIPLRGEGMSWM